MRARNVTTLQAVLFAWGIADHQLVGIPAWVRSERFEINFTPAEAETPISDSDLSSKTQAARNDRWFRQRQRLQAVLRDRFDLLLHPETKELPVYG